jgi:hypothetical protein
MGRRRHYLAYRKLKIALDKGFGAWVDDKHPDLATPEEFSSYVRSLREADRDCLARLGGVNAK